ncbi:trypsin-like peptidase domain-containing protein [Wenyingzhuangia sp. 2_MG-2023]|uniref:trypsin-like peptidase domain-containing protein n=1 Tax=Wenyingzhuangia sp. 2_MG-2023 TaxID=3062639 RepID=UPI0026E18D0D|nr:trypsin-like peptidase domain-containing protein [Wenyingzhuangia sp. 2_MG-2023]MDO6736952.1 trypsin-like peptidase domain-containing protein [Wenyingzhuangia sp. 2_MG-2023]
MKQNIKLFVVALLGGFISLTLYSRFFQNEVKVVASDEKQQLPVLTANTHTSLVAAEKLTDFTTAAEATLNAVVHVKNTSVGVQQDPFAELFYGHGYGSRKYERVGTGSGVVISPDGYIVTNNHVIDGASEIEISLNSQKKYKAELIGADKDNDIALLKIDADDLHYITFGDSDTSKIGEWVLAVGNPYNLTSTVTAGIISAKGRDLEGNSNIESFIQTDAAVNPGNSGGALVNTRGELIGINTAISSQTGSFVGYSFAVPSNIAKRIIEDLMENGSVKRAVLGVTTQAKSDIDGVYISEVSKNTGADKAGMKSGDIIKKINNVKIHKFSELVGQLVAKRPGDEVLVTVERDGIEKVLNVKLSEVSAFVSEAFGIQFGELKVKEKQDLRISGGIRVNKINNKDLQKLGIKPGYVVLSINNFKMNSVADLERVKQSIKSEEQVNKLVVINLEGERETFSRGW